MTSIFLFPALCEQITPLKKYMPREKQNKHHKQHKHQRKKQHETEPAISISRHPKYAVQKEVSPYGNKSPVFIQMQ